jgi:hypothetical protein
MTDRQSLTEDPLKKIDLILEILRAPLSNQQDEIYLCIVSLRKLWTVLFLPWLEEKNCATMNYFVEH